MLSAMNDVALLKKIDSGSKVDFDGREKFCLVMKGKINAAASGQIQEIGKSGVIFCDMEAYALEQSDLLFVSLDKLKAIKPYLAAQIANHMKIQAAGLDNLQPDPKESVYRYAVDVQCPVCGERFKAFKLSESKLKQKKRDTEMRSYYEDIEPVYYKLWICPKCHYANFRNNFDKLSDSQKNILSNTTEEREILLAGVPGPDNRTVKAIQDYQLAIECLKQIKAASSVIASAWLNLAWLYDDLGVAEAAAAARKNSLTAYEEFYLEEQSLTPSLEVQALYIIGELNKRLGNVKQAHEYFLKVLHCKEHNMAMLTELARDGLQDLKQMTRESA
jgi:uncharacterized protein (DUF2225 family)